MAGLSAFVLAGGHSTRMGADKALLEIDGQALIARMLAIARTIDREARIVGGASRLRDYGQVIDDRFAGCGPLGGIHAALRASQSECNLVLAVDMPFVPPEFLRYLADHAAARRALVTVPRVGERWQPLCAVYRLGFTGVAEQALKEGKYKIDILFRQVEVCTLEEGELEDQGFAPAIFRNLNTPEEAQAARAEEQAKRTGKG